MVTLRDRAALLQNTSLYDIAQWADCLAPDHSSSPGGAFLASVVEDTIEAFVTAEDPALPATRERALQEVADGAPSVYTHLRWQQFVDLGGYMEDIGVDVVKPGPDLFDGLLGPALYDIAWRLADSLWDHLLGEGGIH